MATTSKAKPEGWEERPYGLDEPSDADPAERRRALLHLGIVAAIFAVLALATYVIPPLHALRPWLPGEAIPIVHLYGDEPPVASGATIATGAAGGSEDALDDATLANLGGDDDSDGAGEPVIDPTDPAQRATGVRVDPQELEGLAREIEDEGGTAMRAFYDALYRTASGEADAVTRVAHFGDSSIALDGITQTARERLQHRFGDAGHGWVLAARGSLPYRHRGVRHESSDDGWRLMDISHLPLADGHYGLGGYQARSNSGGRATFQTAEEGAPVGTEVSRFEVFYERHPRGGRFEIRVDGGDPILVDTRGEVSDEVHRVVVAEGPHRFDIRTLGRGESHLYGVVLESEGPGVVYDSLGMVGARARRFLGFDRDHLARQLELRGTDLVVIGYGGNDADDNRSEADYEEDFRRVARLVREARPGASCLLFAPLDQAERNDRGRIETMESVPRIVSAMRSAAQAEGCAFFDTFEAMGGEGGMERWYRSRPRLAFGDFRHATPAGYRVLGNMFYKALLKGFADYLERR
ncbi:MAG: GDSL-type esterase/lipase family protein [Myxococcota bacterium]|nr:GDSL-type esterase/lipase family protein [Myxococcota bacterium]